LTIIHYSFPFVNTFFEKILKILQLFSYFIFSFFIK